MTDEAVTIAWNSPTGKKRLFASGFNQDFFTLAHCFQPQIKPTFCGIASAVIICNALRAHSGLRLDSRLDVSIPKSFGGGVIPFNSYSQLTFLNSQTDRVKHRRQVEGKITLTEKESKRFSPGLTMDELAAKMKIHLLRVKTHKANSLSADKITAFRNDLKVFLNDGKVFIIVNYLGHKIRKDVAGHFSPIAVCHKKSGSCLVMDVAGHRHSWFWVDITTLYDAMHSKDNNGWRGWMVVSDRLDV